MATITSDIIKKYINLIRVDDIPIPSHSDCLYCITGGVSGEYRHLIDHIKNGVVPGYLLVNAMREYGYTDDQIIQHYNILRSPEPFRVALRRYLTRRVLGHQYNATKQRCKKMTVSKSNIKKATKKPKRTTKPRNRHIGDGNMTRYAYKTKSDIRNHLTRGEGISLESATTVGGAVSFWIEYGTIRVSGFWNMIEQSIDNIDDLVNYIYRERKRIIYYR